MSGNKVPPIVIKSEPGSYKRLPSFRTPRDLKLTEFQKISSNAADGKSKKVYVPNLNVQRKKPSEDLNAKSGHNDVSKTNDKCHPKSEEKGTRERRKKVPNLIHTSGVFSEGLAPSLKTARWTSRYSDSSAPSMLQMPKLKKDNVKVNKEEEEMVMKELLKDDFIDDPSFIPDLKNCPIKLPLKNFEDVLKKREEDEKNVNQFNDVALVKVKAEPGTEVQETKPRVVSDMAPLSIQKLLSQSADRSFIFFQLPNAMPKEKTFQPTSSKQGPKSASSSQQPNEPEEKSILRNLPSGKIGKLQIMKSGRAKLVLGDVSFIVEPGTQPAFKQDLIAVDLNPSSLTGDMVNLGNVTSRMIVSPDWERLLTV